MPACATAETRVEGQLFHRERVPVIETIGLISHAGDEIIGRAWLQATVRVLKNDFDG